MTVLPDLPVGWEACEPGPPPRSVLLDNPPIPSRSVDPVLAHQKWRTQVERDEHRLGQEHSLQPVWYPIHKPARHRVVPVMGGTPTTWDAMLASLLVAASDSGFDRIQIANLSQWPVLMSVRAIAHKARRMAVRFDSVSSAGSTVDLFRNRDLAELASFLVDVGRVLSDREGMRDAARDKADLLAVGQLLDLPVTLARLILAIDTALGSIGARATTDLTSDEERRLRDYHLNVVSKRPQTADRLDGLFADLRELARYQATREQEHERFGPGQVKARVYDVDATHGIHETEMGREILARALARQFARSSTTLDFLAIAGAEKLAPEVLNSLIGSAQHLSKQLVLLFSEITPLAQRTLGAGGSDFAIFLRLPNSEDAEIAARHFGREFTFVVNGFSIAEGHTNDWGSGTSDTNSSTTTRGSSFGSSFARSVSKSLGSSTGTSTTRNTGQSLTTTTSTGKVHEFVIQPEEFQHLDEFSMLAVEGKRAILASCDYRLRNNRNTSKARLVHPPV